jgi:ubiquinone/menaquinone biosynthesis C-methylase UbiE
MARTINQRFFPEISAGGFSRIDGTVAFYQRIHAVAEKDWVLLDYGAGRGVGHLEDPSRYRRELRSFKNKVARVIGVDVDDTVLSNPSIDEAHVFNPGKPLPIDDKSVNAIVSDFVFEHIEHPEVVVSEFNRILKPGGWIFARTPNKYGYIALVNRAVPHQLKMSMLSKAQPNRKAEDVFPAFYRMNTLATIRSLFPEKDFEHHSYVWDAEPGYHANSALVYWLIKNVHNFVPQNFKSMLMLCMRLRN